MSLARSFDLALACFSALLGIIQVRLSARLAKAQGKILRSLELENSWAFSKIFRTNPAYSQVMAAKFAFLRAAYLCGVTGSVCVGSIVYLLVGGQSAQWLLGLPIVVILLGLFHLGLGTKESSVLEQRGHVEQRAQEVIDQHELAPQRWASRLAPDSVVDLDGFEVSTFYQPGAGAMAGDFFDIYKISSHRLGVAIGDVTGHGLDPAITAFQVKNLLRVYMKQFRDPAQVLFELNRAIFSQVQTPDRIEEMVSMCLVVFDQSAGTLRFASAGHPPAWLYHAGIVRPLRSTGPILALDPRADYFSREIPMEVGDLLLLYTDGLVEVRSRNEMFGEDRVSSILAKDPRQNVSALCSTLVESARGFSKEPFLDDVAIVAVKCTK